MVSSVISQMLQMISQSWRAWKNAKAVAVLAIIALAVGIGCATAIFTVVNGVLLKPLPYGHPERWVALFGGSTLGSEADRRQISPGQLAAKMNSFLYRSTRSESYATFFYAQIDSEGRQLRYANAGHNPPYLVRSAGVAFTARRSAHLYRRTPDRWHRHWHVSWLRV
jgi:stage II sporulation SpoE-like protein